MSEYDWHSYKCFRELCCNVMVAAGSRVVYQSSIMIMDMGNARIAYLGVTDSFEMKKHRECSSITLCPLEF